MNCERNSNDYMVQLHTFEQWAGKNKKKNINNEIGNSTYDMFVYTEQCQSIHQHLIVAIKPN